LQQQQHLEPRNCCVPVRVEEDDLDLLDGDAGVGAGEVIAEVDGDPALVVDGADLTLGAHPARVRVPPGSCRAVTAPGRAPRRRRHELCRFRLGHPNPPRGSRHVFSCSLTAAFMVRPSLRRRSSPTLSSLTRWRRIPSKAAAFQSLTQRAPLSPPPGTTRTVSAPPPSHVPPLRLGGGLCLTVGMRGAGRTT
jgi:hypothetical protein